MQAPQLSRRERKKRENRQRIVQAAIDLFQAQGFDHTPIEAITEKADVSRGTFFNHFASKESVLAEIAALEMEHLEQLVDTELSALPSAVAQIRHLMRALVEDTRPYMHVTRYVLLETMMHHPGEEASTARLSGILIALVEHGQHPSHRMENMSMFQAIVMTLLPYSIGTPQPGSSPFQTSS